MWLHIVGYTYAGMADGNKCYCGGLGYDLFGLSTDCTIPCSGDSKVICGGDDALSVYKIGMMYIIAMLLEGLLCHQL